MQPHDVQSSFIMRAHVICAAFDLPAKALVYNTIQFSLMGNMDVAIVNNQEKLYGLKGMEIYTQFHIMLVLPKAF